MKHIPIFVFSVVLAGVIVLFAISLFAQETPSGSQAASAVDEATAGLTIKEVENGLAAIEADTGLDDAVKAQLRPKYQQAIVALKDAADFAARAADYRAALKTAPANVAALRDELKALLIADGAATSPPSGSVEDLQRAIDSQQATLSGLNDNLLKITSELARVKNRPFEINTRLPEAQRELSDIRKQLASPTLAEDVTSPNRTADRLLLQATQSRLLSEAEMLHQEQLSQSVREDQLQAQSELLKRQVEIAGAALTSLETMMQQGLASEVKRIESLAETMPEDVPDGDKAAQALAIEVQALAREFEDVVRNLEKVKTVQDDVVSRLERLNSSYESIREQLEVSGGGRGMAQILLDMQRQFPDQLAYSEGLKNQVAPLDETRLASFQAKEKFRSQPEVERQFSDHPSEAVKALVATRGEVLEQLLTQYGNLIRSLALLEGNKRQYLDRSKEVRAYASEQLFGFGMRSAPPISLETVTHIPIGLRWFFGVDHWVELGRALRAKVSRMPMFITGIVLVLAVLLITRRRIGAALAQTSTNVRRVATDRYAYTGQALLWTLLLAVPIPLLIGFVAWALPQTPESSSWMRGIVDGLQKATWIVLGLTFLMVLCRPGGLGASHFRWQEKPLFRLRRTIPRFAVVYVPALLITYSGLYERTSDYLFSVGRFSFMLAQAWTAIVLYQVFHFSDGILANFMREKPNHFITRWRYLWFPLIIACPLALAFIAGLGYMITANLLSLGLLNTAAFIAGGVIFYWLTRRWFRVKQRKLALAEATARRRAKQAAADSQGQQQSADILTVDPEDEAKLDLVSINEQTRDLLRLVFSLGVAVAILYLWSDTFPLFATLDAILIPLAGGLTLFGLVRAVLIVVVTYIAVRNLPGLLELAVLRATTIDAGTRNAISTLCQYALIAIGLSLLFNVLKVDWAKLGWIAAALSVGIGFGLQEVVANFVCGLIVLFERPIRVGDYVTVDGVIGTVTKIRIRATTIVNGDRQDFVVPNKRLITGALLNWTLSAGLNRVIIRLGVASGSDTEKARQILLDLATNHPIVLDDPAPLATFEQFGDSSLNLVLYAFLPDLDNRTQTITDLHTEIDKQFAAAGIEIPNPQFDVRHVAEGTGSVG